MSIGHELDFSNVHRFSGGIANENYLIRLDGAPAVLRRPPGSGLAAGANDMNREWRALTGLSGSYALAPKPIAFCSDLTVLGVLFQVLEFREGAPIGAELPTGSSHDAPERLTNAIIGAMADLHALDPDEIGLGDLGRPEGFLARQVVTWRRRAEDLWPKGVPASLDRLATRLADSVPPDDAAPSLLHMDLKFDNMLFQPPHLTANAVIDWDMATRGPALFDLAVLLAYWVQQDDPVEVHALRRVPSLAPGFPQRAEVARRYFARVQSEPQDLVWHVALARLRLGALWMQLFRAWQRGTVVGDVYADFDSLALAILDWAEHHYLKGIL